MAERDEVCALLATETLDQGVTLGGIDVAFGVEGQLPEWVDGELRPGGAPF
jgi:hypothetical protein